ncbi:MAG: thiazole biosynthesis adenylyltransferase ThiF [Bacillus sp. (in: Bacteria)]|nr:thiazole biosynthesis adenylyltransferase ThiF [Bacillus sp. (in: firmicutes)]
MNDRYSRQELFSPIGKEGQQQLVKKHVVIIGAGALGTGTSEALVRAGVGKVTIMDRDYVDWSNLQRQQLYSEEDAKLRLPKAIAAKKRLEQVNCDVQIEAMVTDVTVNVLEELVKKGKPDVLIDATDNFDTRMVINDISQKYGIPWIYGACVGSYGVSYPFIPGKTPCLHCLLETLPMNGLTCDTAGIISPAVQMVAAYQVAETLKILVGDIDAVRRKLISFDVWKNQQSMIDVNSLKREDCPSCGTHQTYPFLSYEHQTKTEVLCGRNTVQIRPAIKGPRDLDELAKVLSRQGGNVEKNPYLVSLEVPEHRLVVFKDGRVLVHGTKDIQEAKTLYHRYLG